MNYLTSLLGPTHEKGKFSCGKKMLDDYIHKQAGQDIKNKVSTCFVLSDDGKVVKGYYTLSSGSIPHSQVPVELNKKLKLPRYKDLPVILLGRLAIDQQFKGEGLGSSLLLDALRRSYATASNAVAAMAVILDPLDEEARRFYQKFGFVNLPDSKRMFLPMKTIEQIFHD
ncbi:MAG TPA: GNAT family N-acetyltransferase [Chitinophagaceae bacterium]